MSIFINLVGEACAESPKKTEAQLGIKAGVGNFSDFSLSSLILFLRAPHSLDYSLLIEASLVPIIIGF